VAKFRSVGRKADSGAPKKRTPETVADVAARMEQSPKKTSPQVSPKDGPLIRNLSQNIKGRFKSSFLSFKSCSHEIFLRELDTVRGF
jgi:hypothetical protein